MVKLNTHKHSGRSSVHPSAGSHARPICPFVSMSLSASPARFANKCVCVGGGGGDIMASPFMGLRFQDLSLEDRQGVLVLSGDQYGHGQIASRLSSRREGSVNETGGGL